jgi:hypothetical protein
MTLGILAFSEGPLSSLGKQDAIAVVTGQALTVALGTEVVGAGTTVVETGQDLNLTLGDETVVTTSVAAVTGQNITSALGTATAVAVANPTVSVSGFGLNAVIGTFAVTAGGQVSIDASAEPDLDIFLGDETVTATANTGALTGQALTTATGTVSVEALTDSCCNRTSFNLSIRNN